MRKEFTSVGESLKRNWARHNVDINAGVSESELVSFEAQHGVSLPEDFRDYFLCVNGMPPEIVDEEMIRFWMLEEVKPLTEAAPQYSDSNYIQHPESLFIFADYSLWAHGYAIRLEATAVKSNEVVIIGYPSPVKLCDSFTEFVHRYLTDKDRLY